jgi:hypothetical protein
VNIIKKVRNLSQTSTSNLNQNELMPEEFNNPFVSSMKNLEKDLNTLKQIYNDELKMMRLEIEELSAVKNKYSLDNFNYEVKLQDFVEK